MSGNELGTKGKASKGKAKVDGLERSELRPRILVPTPAQLERGERVIDADPQIWPGAVAQMVKRCEREGWSVRVTHSQFLAVPPVSGADVGQWVDTHCLVTRIRKEWVGRAWASWLGTQRLGWKFEVAQFWGQFMPRPANVAADQLNGLITSTMTMKLIKKTGEKPDEDTIFCAVEKVARPAVVHS